VPVLSVTSDQDIDLAGQTTDVYEVTFTVTDRPGVFTVRVPTIGDPVAAAAAKIGATKEQVLGIYGTAV
jgi:hypothetical protein